MGGLLCTASLAAAWAALCFVSKPSDTIAVQELVDDIERRIMHLSTSFVGSPYLNHVLSDNGRLDSAFARLKQAGHPDCMLSPRVQGPSGSVGTAGPKTMTFNHYAYGAIGEWLYTVVVGINFDPDKPGHKHIILKPQPGGGLDFARATLETPHGQLISNWKLGTSEFTYSIVVPPNTTTTITLPVHGTTKLNGKTTQVQIHKLQPGKYKFRVSL